MSATLRIQLKLDAETRIGSGKIRLLEEIDRTGSISAAARAMDMTYRRGWDLIDQMNKAFGQPLVLGTTGGQGGAQLTDLGRAVVSRFRVLEAEVMQVATVHLKAIDDLKS